MSSTMGTSNPLKTGKGSSGSVQDKLNDFRLPRLRILPDISWLGGQDHSQAQCRLSAPPMAGVGKGAPPSLGLYTATSGGWTLTGFSLLRGIMDSRVSCRLSKVLFAVTASQAQAIKPHRVTHPEKQWAAVSTHSGLSRDPPHTCTFCRRRLACHGHMPARAAWPPTIRLPACETWGWPHPDPEEALLAREFQRLAFCPTPFPRSLHDSHSLASPQMSLLPIH